MQHVALFGLGIMGGGLASNLLKKGFPLTLWNRTRAKSFPFEAQGAKVAATPAEAASGADVLISMVGDDAASRTVWLGDEGALATAKPGSILVEMSTLSLEWVKELAALAAEKSLRFIDSPVTGSKAAAANAQLLLIIGAEAADIDAARPVLEAVSNKIAHMGAVGAGTTWKLINNMMLGVQISALAEALAMAERAGLDMAQVNERILQGASASMMVQGKLPRMMERRYEDTDFSLKWMQKDLDYAIKLANSLDLPLKTVEAAFDVLQFARDKDLDETDVASVVEGFRD